MRWAVKRLNGWDAMLLCSETPNVHTHTLKIGVIEVTDFDGDFTFELFRRTLRRRLHLLKPLRYKLVDIPLKLHHPMWLERSDVDLAYHLRRVRLERRRVTAGDLGALGCTGGARGEQDHSAPTTSASAGPANEVFNSSALALIRLAATTASTKPRWLRHIIPTVLGGPPGIACSAAASASERSVELTPAQRAELVHQSGPIRTTLR